MSLRWLGWFLWWVPLGLHADHRPEDRGVGGRCGDVDERHIGAEARAREDCRRSNAPRVEASLRATDGKVVKRTIHTCVTKEDLQNSAVFDSDSSEKPRNAPGK